MQHKLRRIKKTVVSATAAAIVVVVNASDSRLNPKPASRRYALRTAARKAALRDPLCNEGWFLTNMRCSRRTFDAIVARNSQRWARLFDLLRPKARFGVQDRVVIALYYLTHGCSAYAAGQKVGAGKIQA
ncbi:hypothetical protein PI124_g17381 [Phytophthora idaei]|nr:hypothetical protein PI125_g18636 [Phytophthora idaei]KAG3137961.1 hypothetical protein PI126_g17129 [Phytophthora idaei]KAG3237646.1 hypothetical protein PI124_g17381 [Phytophthora idaei]